MPTTQWDRLLVELAELPRENGTPALERSAHFLYETLSAMGIDTEFFAFTATPYVLRLAGVLALAAGLLYWRWMRSGRSQRALWLAVVAPVLLLLQLDFQVPIFGWIGAQEQQHVVARLPARAAEQRLVFTAHYDTKTDLFDHVERAPVDLLTLPLVLTMLAAAALGVLGQRRPLGPRLRRLPGVGAWLGAGYGVAMFLVLSAGALVPGRSPGAIDDGASCAVLVRLVEELARAAPLERTEIEIVLLSAEEIGVQGSWVYAQQRFGAGQDLSTFVVNLEGLGTSPTHAILRSESFTLRSFAPDERLAALIGRAHEETLGSALVPFRFGGATDARSFLAAGVPALTLISIGPDELYVRDLHSIRDARSRLDERALDASLRLLQALVARVEARGIGAS